MSVAVLYESTELQFNTLGLGPLREAESCLVTEERNGVFELSLDYPITGALFKELKNTRIIKAHAGPALRDQRFRINRVSKVFNKNGKKYVTIYAEHVSYLTQELPMLPEVHIVTLNAYEALRVWKSAILDSNPFTVHSDITTIGSTNWHIREVENPRMALGGVEGSLLDIYGGEYKFDNYTISLLKQRGKKANTIIKYGRNLTDLTQDEYINTTYTAVYPYAIYTDDQQKEHLITVDGYITNSEHVSKYPNRKVLPIDFSSEFDQDNLPTKAKLLALAKTYIKANNVGIPRVSIKLEYIDLSQTLDYKDLAVFEEINLCDELPVYFSEMDIKTTAKVVRVVWDNIMDRYETIELGETKTTLSNVINNIETNISNVQTTVNEVQLAANGKNMVFRGPDKPTAQKIGDQWYKPVGDDTELYIWNGSEWEFVMSTAPDPEIKKAIEELEKTTVKNKEEITKAVEKADQSIEEAGFAKDAADNAKSIANQATTNANQAINDAKNALDQYNNLDISTRNIVANSKILTRERNVDFLTLIPIKAKTSYSVTAKIKLSKKARIRVYINDDKGTSRPATTTFFDGELPDGESIIKKTVMTTTDGNNTTNKVYLRFYAVNDTTLNFTVEEAMLVESDKPVPWLPAPEDVQVQITNINGELGQKVSQTTFNQLQGTVTQQGTAINQNKKDIALKANQSAVNTLTGRVSSAESKLTVQSGQISGLVTKTDGQATEIANLTLTANGLNSTVSKVQTELNNLDFGVRNLFSEAKTETMSLANQYSFKNLYDAQTSQKSQFFKTLEREVEYTLTVRGKGSEFGEMRFYIQNPNVYNYSKMVTFDSNELTTKSLTFVIPKSIDMGLGFTFGVYDMKQKGGCYLEWAVLTKGNKAVNDCILAPEDMATQVEFSNLQQTVNGIQTTVSGKADQSQITQLSNQITSVVKDIDQVDLKTRIAGGLVLSPDPDFSKSLNEIIAYNNAGNGALTVIRESVPAGSQPTGNPYRLQVKTTAAANPAWGGIMRFTMSRINAEFVVRFTALLPVGRVFWPANNSLGTGATVKWLTPNVGTGMWEEYIYHVKCGNSGTFASFGHLYVTSGGTPTVSNPLIWYLAKYEMIDITQSNQSQITQLKDMINLKVEKNQIISQINISPENILLDSKLIHLSGKSKIDDAVITSAMIANAAITSAKIQDAAITSAKILNVDAGKLTSGFIDSNRIQARSITADKLTTDAIQVGFNAMGNTIKISPTELNFYSTGNLTGRLTDVGMEFWYGTRKIGRMGHSAKYKNESVRGIAMELEKTGDYITWSYDGGYIAGTAGEKLFREFLIFDPRGLYTGYPGVVVESDIYLNGKLGVKGATQGLRIISSTINGQKLPALYNEGLTSGIAIGATELYLVKSNTYYTLSQIIGVVNTLKGLGVVMLPTSFRSDGSVGTYRRVTL